MLAPPTAIYTHSPGLTGSIVSNNHYHQWENNWTNELAYETTFYIVVWKMELNFIDIYFDGQK
jgi:hypothetical protein